MSTLADSLVDAASRPLHLRMRPDLAVRRHTYLGRPYWVVKEPVGLKYFRFEEEEFAILEMLDGHASMEQIKTQFEREYTPQKIAYSDLQHFIGSLYRSGLLVADAPGQGEHLYRRHEVTLWNRFVGAVSNVLAMRFRGIDPERLLNFLLPFTWWFFTRWAVMGVGLLGAAAITLVAVQWHTFQTRLPAFDDFFGAHNWLWLGGTLAVVKILHEFGHGLSCKRFGGECHEMGFMMLVLTPCLYCNVSDSWMLPNKWHRAAIGAAGMYVELLLASLATFIWWNSSEGLLNFLALRVMFICSVSTVLFNGNPLLRYDGYYILSDLLEIPNLRQKSTQTLKRLWLEYGLGIEQQDDPFLPQSNRLLFAAFTVASVAYRWLVMFSIFLFLNRVLEPYGLKRIGQVVAVAGILGLAVQPLMQLWKFLKIPGRVDQVKAKNVLITSSVAAALIGFVGWVPLPHWVYCSLKVNPQGAVAVYVETPGKVVETVQPGDAVAVGDAVARLENPGLALAMVEQQGRLAEKQEQLRGLRNLQFTDTTAGSHIRETEAEIRSLKQQIAEKQLEIERLVVRATVAGTVLPPEEKPREPGDDRRLRSWTGSPLDDKNRGAYLTASEVVCRIGDPHRLEAELVIDQSDIDFVARNQEVSLQLEAFPGRIISSKIYDIAPQELKFVPTALSSKGGGNVATRTEAGGGQAPLSTSYQAKAALEDEGNLLRLGMRGQARVYTPWMSLGYRLWRWAARTFHFEL